MNTLLNLQSSHPKSLQTNQETQISNITILNGQYSFSNNDILGRGFSSIVYKGHHTKTQQPVAIKVIKHLEYNKLNHPEDPNLNLLEAQLQCLKNLTQHPNLLKFYATEIDGDSCYVVTQLCDGGDLATTLLKKIRFREVEEFTSIFKDLWNGYKQLRKLGYIHRDLKPANIFYNSTTKSFKIGDFGFAKKYPSIQNQHTKRLGSPFYMPLESLIHNITNPKTDLWSIGVLSYQLLTGKVPWSSCRTQIQLRQTIANNQFDINNIHISISNDLKDLLKKLLDINTDTRISVQEVDKHPWVQKIMRNQVRKSLNNTSPINRTRRCITLKFEVRSEKVLEASSVNINNNSIKSSSILGIVKISNQTKLSNQKNTSIRVISTKPSSYIRSQSVSLRNDFTQKKQPTYRYFPNNQEIKKVQPVPILNDNRNLNEALNVRLRKRIGLAAPVIVKLQKQNNAIINNQLKENNLGTILQKNLSHRQQKLNNFFQGRGINNNVINFNQRNNIHFKQQILATVIEATQ